MPTGRLGTATTTATATTTTATTTTTTTATATATTATATAHAGHGDERIIRWCPKGDLWSPTVPTMHGLCRKD